LVGSIVTYGGITITCGGVTDISDSNATTAMADMTTAYNDAASRTANTLYTPVYIMGDTTLDYGVYKFPSSLELSGTIILDGQGNPDAVFVFQIGSTLMTDSNAAIVMAGDASASNVFWQVGSSCTLGASTAFQGTILAYSSITFGAGSTLSGRAMAETASVNLAGNTIYDPTP
jgi:hypothetical protein